MKLFPPPALQTLFIWGFLLAAAIPALCQADGPESEAPRYAPVADPTGTQTEDTRDPRLPPALPGESMADGKRSMKVWSTGGSVTTGAAPAPNDPSGCAAAQDGSCGSASGSALPKDVSVFVEQRDDRPRDRSQR